MLGRIRLTQAHLTQMVQHAREEYPNEACGLLAGRGDQVERVYRMANKERSPVTYLMEPQEQFRVFTAIEEAGWELVGIYHSHTHSPAYPSATDVRLAFYPDAVYVIISLADPSRPAVRAFRIQDNAAIAEEEMVVA